MNVWLPLASVIEMQTAQTQLERTVVRAKVVTLVMALSIATVCE